MHGLQLWYVRLLAPIAGKYTVVQDDWVDWSPGDEVDVLDGAVANTINISKVWPNPAYGSVVNPLTITVNPATGAATIPSGLVWGDYGSLASTGAGSSGFAFSCTGLITMSIRIVYGGSDFGSYKLILQKK